MFTSRLLMLAMIFGLLMSACAPAAETPVPELAPAGTDIPDSNQLPPPGGSQPTDVKFILALQDAPIYGGQEVQYGVIGVVAAGQIAGVTGKSADGNWWRVGCPGDSVDGCWVSASAYLTEPTTAPHENQLPPPGGPQSTEVKFVLALQDVPIYGGQEVQYGVIGNVAAGQIAGVIGKSADGKWWQVGCPGDSVDGCWISASADMTEPTTAPHENQLPPPGGSQPTDVKYILALQDVPIYGGQEVQYGVIGNVAAGQIAGVTGRSADGKWWQVGCPGDSVDGCWVTANPAYTEPTEPPG